jgi:predicted ArsR family transcriptional regulator
MIKLTAQQQTIYDLLCGGGQYTAHELTAATGFPTGSVRSTLNQLRRAGIARPVVGVPNPSGRGRRQQYWMLTRFLDT